MTNDANKAPGLKAAISDLRHQQMRQVYQCDPSHTVDENEDTNICCPGCGQLCDLSLCWCGEPRETHGFTHDFVPMGCDCHRAKEPEPPPMKIVCHIREPEVEYEWDIL